MSLSFFGDPWDAPACDDAEPVATPVGVPCLQCTEQIALGDQGFMMSSVRLSDEGRPVGGVEPIHWECHLRSVIGNVAHLEGRCTPLCHGDGSADGEPEKSFRAEGREVVEWLERHAARESGPRATLSGDVSRSGTVGLGPAF